jgi:UPF0755 protein
LKRLVFLVIFAALIGGAGILLSLWAPYRGFVQDAFLDFDKGTSTRAMAGELANRGVVRFSWQFLAIRALRPGARLQAGEYRFTTSASPWTVFDRIVRGDVFYYEVTIPEGSNLFDIANALDGYGIVGSKPFLAAARNTALIRDLSPHAETLEGYLFPSTYRFTRKTAASQLCQIMTDQFRHEWQQLTAGHPMARSEIARIVTLASLVEKETGHDAERPLVASVFRNRLERSMPLQCDPTTIYAALLEDRYRGTIHRSDLENRNAYNTYQHPGLPPGPITNPGAASLKAALSPAPGDYLYFVAKGDGSGTHNFSSDYAAHAKNVLAYRHAVTQGKQSR